MPTRRHSGLKPAHRGYLYQDLLTAQCLALQLVERWHEVVVDKKLFAGDLFDDLQIDTGLYTVRRQVKHSSSPGKKLSVGDLRKQSSPIRIDLLFESFLKSGTAIADEYRVCANWAPPEDSLSGLLVLESDGVTTVFGVKTIQYSIDGEALWAKKSDSAWSCLRNIEDQSKGSFFDFLSRLTIELSLPNASFDLDEPGPLESVLIRLLREKIGIGAYPNHNRSVIDVAAHLVGIATRARAQSEALNVDDVEFQLGLRTDFGRVAQEFPIDYEVLQERDQFRHELRERAESGSKIAVVGPPGSGKSWELTRLADEMRTAGLLVCRHYCYLEPGDDFVEQRIIVNSMFANLIAELIDQDPGLRQKQSRRYSVGIDEFEELIGHASEMDVPVVVIVDGLDHVDRVLREARNVSDYEAGLVEQIASLSLPKRVSLLIGSQPGSHLDPIRKGDNALEEVEIPEWSPEETDGLARTSGLFEVLRDAEYDQEIPQVLSAIHDRSEGNPLYATYLCRQLMRGVSTGEIVDAEEWLSGTPELHGDIENYYEFLYAHASDATKAIADIMGVIDFGVTKSELQEILVGPVRGWVEEGISLLNPILKSVATQGGMRIFHESFRRFMMHRIAVDGRDIAQVLRPVISWLEARGFFSDAKAYRFLLPCLYRAGRLQDVLALVAKNFVSESVTNGHPYSGVLRNLAIAAEAASTNVDFPKLLRFVELHRSAHTCYEDKLHDATEYWRTFIDLFGGEATSRRLLFDGAPTQSKSTGMRICSLIDDAGSVAPWYEYMRLDNDQDENSWTEGDLSAAEQASLIRVHGRLCVDGEQSTLESIGEFLTAKEQKARPTYLASLFGRILSLSGKAALRDIYDKLEPLAPDGGDGIKAAFGTAGLELASLQKQSGNLEAARKYATQALNYVDDVWRASQCVLHGAPAEYADRFIVALDTLDVTSRLGANEDDVLQRWIGTVRILAFANSSAIKSEYTRIHGEGWYRCWLRFLLDLAVAESRILQGGNRPNLRDLLLPLAEDIRPFSGDPRPCDLYFARHLIRESIDRTFALFQSKSDWEVGLKVLEEVHNGTSSRLDRSPTGPLNVGMLLDACLPYAKDDKCSTQIVAFARRLIEAERRVGTYFESHAEHEMRLVRILVASQRFDEAHRLWQEIGTYLAGYGFRKDITIFELVDSVPAFGTRRPKEGVAALERSQPLVNVMVRHTDGRSTNRAPNAWFRSLLACDCSKAISLLARSMRVRDASIGWVIENAIQDALDEASSGESDTRLVAGLHSSIPFEVEYEEGASSLAIERLKIVRSLLDQDRDAGEVALRRLAAQVVGDKRRHIAGAAVEIRKFADEYEISVPELAEIQESREQDRSANGGSSATGEEDIGSPLDFQNLRPLFGATVSSVEILSGIRRACANNRLRSENADGFVNALGFRLLILIEDEGSSAAVRMLRFFAREFDRFSSENQKILEKIGQGLVRFGCKDVAAIAFALSFIKGRGGGGWYSIGGDDDEPSIIEARTLARAETEALLALELARMLQTPFYNAGVSKSVIKRIANWGDLDKALSAWNEVFGVVSHRLPTKTDAAGVFESLEETELPNWKLDEALIGLVLARLNHPECWKKFASICALADLVATDSTVASKPVVDFLSYDSTTTSIILVLATLFRVESKPYNLTKSLVETLQGYTSSGLWTIASLASALLNRAGIEAGAIRRPSRQDGQDTELEHSIDTYLSIDPGERMACLRRLDDRLPRRVVEIFAVINGASELHKERTHERYELAMGRELNSKPATPVLYWEQELFETALAMGLNDLADQAWQRGSWSLHFADELLGQVLPALDVHVGIFRNRQVRPSIPLPSIRQPGRSDILKVHDDPVFSGWYRLAYIESQWLREGERHFDPPTRMVTVLSGAVAADFGSGSSEEFPFRKGKWQQWIANTDDSVFELEVPNGPLTCLDRVKDWLGDELIACPPLPLQSRLGLKPSNELGALSWVDANGNTAICLRSWRMRDRHALWADPLEFKGTDVLVRPDVYSRLQSAVRGRLIEDTVIWSRPLD